MRFLKKLADVKKRIDSDNIIEIDNENLEMIISKLIKKVTGLNEDGFYIDDYSINFNGINDKKHRTAEYVELEDVLNWIEKQ